MQIFSVIFIKTFSFPQQTYFLFQKSRNSQYFQRESTKTRILGVKGTEETVPQKRSLSSIMKVLNRPIVRNQFLEQTLSVPGSILLDFHKQYLQGEKQREEFTRRISKSILLKVKDNEEHIPKNRFFSPINKIFLKNDCFLMQKIILRNVKDFPKNWWLGYSLLQLSWLS